MRGLLDRRDLILIEAAVVERLRRGGRVELHPRLVHAPLLYDENGRRELRKIFQSYIDIAGKGGIPLLLCTPTWRANRERIHESDISHRVNRDAVQFMTALRDNRGAAGTEIRIGGLVGCRNDCYKPEESLSVEESEEFHSWQIDRLAEAGVDFLIAETLPNVNEAIGIARAMSATGVPFIISFVINRQGCVLDSTPLLEATSIVADATANQALGFMVNCAHPTFLNAGRQPRQLFTRLIGYQANASSLDHADLDGIDRLEAGEVSRWGDEMLMLNREYGVKILGGCCGTGVDHLAYIVTGARRAESNDLNRGGS
jgi:S-methylmethionine-dependent homocysteine/selenocysteine methylase